MKKLLPIVLFFVANFCFAQTPNPVAWKVHTEKNNLDSTLQLKLDVTLDKGWHIFAFDAGGDGMAINTNVEIENFNIKNKKINKIIVTDSFASEKPVSVDMKGFGTVHYFNKNFSYTIPLPKITKSGIAKISYQSCNENMCLPPVENTYKFTTPSIKIKK